MPNPFSAIEAIVNQGTLALIANAEADFGSGLVVSGIFDEFPAVAFDVVSNPKPQFRCLQSAVSTVVKNSAVAINSVSYTVYSKSPDGTGMTVIDLNKV